MPAHPKTSIKTARPMQWISEKPIWVEQWPLTREKLDAVTTIVQELLSSQKIRPTTSPWNTPIFVVKKKSGKWRLLQDLRAINKVILPMGALQPGMPIPSAIPESFFKIVIDLQDCFFTIRLHPSDVGKFAFSIPKQNLSGPMDRFEWLVLPQGMKNSPTLAQIFVAEAIKQVQKKWSAVLFLHYMDDILMAAEDRNVLFETMKELIEALEKVGLKIAPDKIQLQDPFNYLGFVLKQGQLCVPKFRVSLSDTPTLFQLQQFLGNLQFIRPYLKLEPKDLKLLYDLLSGSTDPASCRPLTPDAKKAINHIEDAIFTQYVGLYDNHSPIFLILLQTELVPSAVIWQKGTKQAGKVLYWMSASLSTKLILSTYYVLVAQLILKMRKLIIQIFAKEPDFCVLPYTIWQYENLLNFSDDWGLALLNFPGEVLFHLPKDPVLNFVSKNFEIYPMKCVMAPMKNALNIFTDGSSSGLAAVVFETGMERQFQTEYKSAQLVELFAVLQAFRLAANDPFNLFSDSVYIVKAIPFLETASFLSSHSNAIQLFLEIQNEIRSRKEQFFIGHIRAHQNFNSPLTNLNRRADELTRMKVIGSAQALTRPVTPYQRAVNFHSVHHVSSEVLRKMFGITREQARQIVKDCPICVIFISVPSLGINPRGLFPNEIWQMDVTHLPFFGRLKYVHVIVDTFSHWVCASALTGENSSQVIDHVLSAMSILGHPMTIKTDNGPGYTAAKFKNFCAALDIKLVHGIPYNPKGQAIVERMHQLLKNTIEKLKDSTLYDNVKSSPRKLLAHALFIINHLRVDEQGLTAMDRHWKPPTQKNLGHARWKDPATNIWHGPDPLLYWGRGYACILQSETGNTRWLPERLIRPISNIAVCAIEMNEPLL